MKNIYTVLNETYNEVKVFTKIKNVRDYLYSLKIEYGFTWNGAIHDMITTASICERLKIDGIIIFDKDEKQTESFKIERHRI